MASSMTPPPHAPQFLADCGWEGAEILPLAGDASFRGVAGPGFSDQCSASDSMGVASSDELKKVVDEVSRLHKLDAAGVPHEGYEEMMD